jgi:DNA-binding transcriptional MerR regulator
MAGTADDDRTVLLSWAVGTVAEQVGVSTSTLRSWERRYGLGPTRRTGGNHRRYGPGDVLRIRLMALLTAQGMPARDAADAIAAMDDRAVAARLAAGPSAGRVPSTATATAPPSTDAADEWKGDAPSVDEIVAAARDLDAISLVHLYRRALRRLELSRAWSQVLAPALRRIGGEWETGRLGVESEHLASELLASELRAVIRARRLGATGRPVLLVSADDEQHHLPLLAVEAELARIGVPSVYLGPRVPARSTARAVERAGARAVFVWASIARPRTEPLWGLLGGIPQLRVVIGGPGWPDEVQAHDAELDLRRAHDLDSAVQALVD